MGNLNDKVVIVTGASSGIGEALALELYEKGAKLMFAARGLDGLQSLAKDMDPVRVVIHQTDVSKEDECKTMIQATLDKYGAIDVLINNAGISMRALFNEVDLGVIQKLMNTNFWGTVYCTKHALPAIIESKGSIVGVSSIAGYKGLPGRTGYSASKFAIHGFLESLRIELLEQHVHVLLACPGFTKSKIRENALQNDGARQGSSPRKESKMMSAEEVARKIVGAIENRKRDLILTSEGKWVVRLNKLFPAWLDKKVLQNFQKEEGDIK